MDRKTSNERQPWPGSWVEGTRHFLTRHIWSIELGGLPTFRALAYKLTRVLFLAVRGFVEDRCMFRASALTYVTVLSLVPLLAFAFSVAKGLGAYDALVDQTINPFLDETFGPATVGDAPPAEAPVRGGREVRQAIEEILGFVKTTNVGSLGFLGFIILVSAVIKLLGSIEHSFNDIWGVKKARTIVRKLADYLSMVIIVPIFLVTATGITTTIAGAESVGFLKEKLHLGPLIQFYLRFSSLVAVWLGFTFVFMFMPNTRTRLKSALIGGIVGGTLWHVAQVLHVRFQVGMANYNAIYSGFAAIPVFLVWIYFSWVTVLLGAEFAFAHQNEPNYRQIARARQYDHAFREVLAVRCIARIAAAFLQGRDPYRASELADELGVPPRSVEEVHRLLQDQRIVSIVEDGPEPGVLPARDLDQITVKQVLDALKGSSGPVNFPPKDPVDRGVDAILRDFERETDRCAHNRNARELADALIAGREERADDEESATREASSG